VSSDAAGKLAGMGKIAAARCGAFRQGKNHREENYAIVRGDNPPATAPGQGKYRVFLGSAARPRNLQFFHEQRIFRATEPELYISGIVRGSFKGGTRK